MGDIDKHQRLQEEPFSYKLSRDRKVFVFWYGKQVKILKDKESEKFLAGIENLTAHELQLRMAKVTGNFKRGNE